MVPQKRVRMCEDPCIFCCRFQDWEVTCGGEQSSFEFIVDNERVAELAVADCVAREIPATAAGVTEILLGAQADDLVRSILHRSTM